MNTSDGEIGDFVLGADGCPVEIDCRPLVPNCDIIEVLLDGEGEFAEIDGADDLGRLSRVAGSVGRGRRRAL